MDLSNGKLTSLLQSCLFGSLCILLNGCLGGGGGGTSSTFVDESTTYTYNASTDATWRARQEYKNVAQYLSDSTIHPYTLIGVNYAYGMGLSGSGKTIAILDTDFKNSAGTTHGELSGKTINTYGTITTGGSSSQNYHGLHVAGLAAAGYHNNSASFVTSNTNTDDWSSNNYGYLRNSLTGSYPNGYYPLLNYGMMGVAYNADLHFSDFSRTSSGSSQLHFANATNDAKSKGAIVQNNSWGFSNSNLTIDQFINYQNNNNTTDGATFVALGGDSATNWDSYASALNSFQSTGVIVRSAGNTQSKSEVGAYAGMPLIYTELAEAWLAVGNIDISGSSITSSSVTRKGNQCGQAAEFCIQADGTQLTSSVGGWGGSSETGMYQNYTGTSMAAPVVSGAVALLSEAFPNHTPAQLVDRILASANNDFFTATGTTSFANGITHGYNAEFGHGIVDLEKALQPILTSSMVPPSNGKGENSSSQHSGNINSAKRFSLASTKINLGPAFGDSLKRALNGKRAFFYDGLNGGFAFDYGSLVDKSAGRHYIKLPIDYLKNELGYKKADTPLGFTMMSVEPNSGNANQHGMLMFAPGPDKTIGFAGQNINIQNALSYSANNVAPSRVIENGNPFSIPFLIASENGSVLGLKSKTSNGEISFGLFNGKGRNSQLQTQGGLVSYGLNFSGVSLSTFLGSTSEKMGLLDSSVSGAFAEKSAANTHFAGFGTQGSLVGGWNYQTIVTLGRTNLDVKGVSLLDDVKDVVTSSFAIEFRKTLGFEGKSNLYVSISQPALVERGKAGVYIPGLYNKGGDLVFDKQTIGLRPSGRQIDLGIGYLSTANDGLKFGLQSTLTRDRGHVRTDRLDIGLRAVLKAEF